MADNQMSNACKWQVTTRRMRIGRKQQHGKCGCVVTRFWRSNATAKHKINPEFKPLRAWQLSQLCLTYPYAMHCETIGLAHLIAVLLPDQGMLRFSFLHAVVVECFLILDSISMFFLICVLPEEVERICKDWLTLAMTKHLQQDYWLPSSVSR